MDAMVRVMIVANASLLADSIRALLEQENNLVVHRLTYQEFMNLDSSFLQKASIVIFVELQETEFHTSFDIVRDHSHGLTITMSPYTHHLHISARYEAPNPGIGEVIELVRAFSRME